MSRTYVLALTLAAFLFTGPPASAAESPLEFISSDAILVLRLKSPNTARESLAVYLDHILPGLGIQVRNRSDALGGFILNPKLAGVDLTSDWYQVVYREEGAKPAQSVFVIPASDIGKMHKALGPTIPFLEHRNWGIYSSDRDALARLQNCLKGDGQSFAALLDKESRESFDRGELSVYINLEPFVKRNENQVDESLQNLATKLAEFDKKFPVTTSPLPAFAYLASRFHEVFLQGFRDSKCSVTTVSIVDDVLEIEQLIRMQPDSSSDRFLTSCKTSAFPALQRLPKSAVGYFGYSNLSGLTKWALQIPNLAAMTTPDENMQNEIQDLRVRSALVNQKAHMVATYLREEPHQGLEVVTLTETDAPDRLRELALEQWVLENRQLLQHPEVESVALTVRKETYGDAAADLNTIILKPIPTANKPLAVAPVVSPWWQIAMYPGGACTTRSIPFKDSLVTTVGGTRETLSRVLQSLGAPILESGSLFQKARARLNETCNLLVMVDIPLAIAKCARYSAEAEARKDGTPVRVTETMIEGLGLKPSYAGFTVGAEPGGIRCRLNLPSQQIRKIGAAVVMLGLSNPSKPEGAKPAGK